GLGTLGIESENHALDLTYLYTRLAEDKTTLAEDTKGKAYFFPGYDPNDPTAVGNQYENLDIAPYVRLETLEYTERTTQTVQLRGEHKLPLGELELGDAFRMHSPKLDWTLSHNEASLDEPDKRQFGGYWHAASYNPGAPPFVPPFTSPA